MGQSILPPPGDPDDWTHALVTGRDVNEWQSELAARTTVEQLRIYVTTLQALVDDHNTKAWRPLPDDSRAALLQGTSDLVQPRLIQACATVLGTAQCCWETRIRITGAKGFILGAFGTFVFLAVCARVGIDPLSYAR